MKTHNRTMKRLAAALTLCVAPAVAFAGDNMKDMSAEAREAYREGQIWATYAGNASLDSYDIKVDVAGSRATLTGTVDSEIEKQLAERIALRTDGVDSVSNNIKVDSNALTTYYSETYVAEPVDEPDFGDYVGDKTAEAMVKSKLLWNTVTDGTDIDVEVLNNTATLSGVADSEVAKRAAERIALDTNGVIRVTNNLRVSGERMADTRMRTDADRDDREYAGLNETGRTDRSDRVASTDGEDVITDKWIEARVNSSMMWSNAIDGGDVDVKVNNGIVTLTGAVASEWAKDRAEEIARDIRGVERVNVSGLEVQDYGDRVTQR